MMANLAGRQLFTLLVSFLMSHHFAYLQFVGVLRSPTTTICHRVRLASFFICLVGRCTVVTIIQRSEMTLPNEQRLMMSMTTVKMFIVEHLSVLQDYDMYQKGFLCLIYFTTVQHLNIL